jgi:hypothetical protein
MAKTSYKSVAEYIAAQPASGSRRARESQSGRVEAIGNM